MKTRATFYHAGCPVCLDAESSITDFVDKERYDVEVVHLGETKDRLQEAEQAGVASVPALVVNGTALHINFGAKLEALR